MVIKSAQAIRFRICKIFKGKLMKLRSILFGLLAAASFSMANSADHYNNYALGVLAAGSTQLANPETGAGIVQGGRFQDTYSFSLGMPSDLAGSASILEVGGFAINAVTFNYSLYSGQTLLASGGNQDVYRLTSLAGGDYSFVVSGNATGRHGGSYDGFLSVTAVPEPETYAMFLAGLGIIGAVVRRRRIDA